MNNLISVIVPIFNTEKFLLTCLESIRTQTYTNLQVILVDDGSTDCSAEIAQQFVERDARFSLLRQKNRGQSAARNVGLQQVTGEFIAFVDSDDFLATNYFQTLISAIENADVLQFGYTRTDENGKPLAVRLPRHKFQFVSPCTRFFRAEILQKNAIRFPEGNIYEDVVFSIDLWRAKPQIRQMKYADYYYRTTPNSTTSKPRDTKPVFALINEKLRLVKRSDIALRLKIRYLQLRLKLHFLFGRN